jgi:hypothetical protein
MAKDNIRRIPFVLNLEDPVDAAIWEALEPMLERRRASQFIRGAVAHALGVGGLLAPIAPSVLPAGEARLGLPSGEIPRAKRPTRRATVEREPITSGGPEAIHSNGDESAVDEAVGNFLNMFG